MLVIVIVATLIPVRVPAVSGVFIVAPIPVRIADPATGTVVDVVSAVFRLLPTSVSVVVAGDAYAVISVGVTPFIAVREGHSGHG
jgi:hypothetical protein